MVVAFASQLIDEIEEFCQSTKELNVPGIDGFRLDQDCAQLAELKLQVLDLLKKGKIAKSELASVLK